MSGRECKRQIEPADAARALSEISQRREQVIRRTAAPRWYWWATAVLVIAFSADADHSQRRGALFWAGVALLAAGMLAVNGLQLSREFRGAPLRLDLVARLRPETAGRGSGPRGGRDRRVPGDRAQPGGGPGALPGDDRLRSWHGGVRGRRADADAVPHSPPGAPGPGAGDDRAQVRRADPRAHPAVAGRLPRRDRVGGLRGPARQRRPVRLALSKQLATLEGPATSRSARLSPASGRARRPGSPPPAGPPSTGTCWRSRRSSPARRAGGPSQPAIGSRSAASDGGPAPRRFTLTKR